MARAFTGDAAGAVAPLAHGLRLDPHDRQNFVWNEILAWAHLLSDHPGQALECATRAMKIRPDWRPALEIAACCHARLGDRDAAHACVEQMDRLEPPPGDVLAPLRRRNPRWVAEADALLRAARS
jgi:uncharacterized membrane-anchored protein